MNLVTIALEGMNLTLKLDWKNGKVGYGREDRNIGGGVGRGMAHAK